MILDKIVATKKKEVEELRQGFSIKNMENIIAGLPPCRGFKQALVKSRRKMGLIAEVKKASPSKGLIRADFEPVELARSYESAGADCISVLTDKTYFQGSSAYLRRVRDHVTLPVLRKDFTIDEIQVYESRVIGADAVLLIVAILNDDELKHLLQLTRDLGMDALVEVHDCDELERALEVGADLIGINNRDLRTFETTLDTSAQLLQKIPDTVTKVSESGISERKQIEWLYDAGADAVLVGEHFMRQPDVALAVEQLMGPIADDQAAEQAGRGRERLA
jgi:indole-3-glycerol phosphate synthase